MVTEVINRYALYLLILCLLTLQACAAKEKPVQGMKIGMHIDAVLEFTVAYPLEWTKDRRLTYGSSNGEVRWTNPENPEVVLRIFSNMHDEDSTATASWFRKIMPEYSDQEILFQEKRKLPAGEALHLKIRTSRKSIEAFKLTADNRDYTIVLLAPQQMISAYNAVMDKIVNSFTTYHNDPE